MIDLKTLRDDCALMVHDPSYNEISKAQWIAFMRTASMDARNAGWLLPAEDDESITIASNTYEYTVPTSFAYVDRLFTSETINNNTVYVNEVPGGHWEIRLNGGVPVFSFASLTQLDVGRTIKVIGQSRPTLYVEETQPIDGGMESFLRERALYFAFRFLGAGSSELAAWRRTMSTQSWQSSEMLLHRHPQEFREHPNAREVPGRG